MRRGPSELKVVARLMFGLAVIGAGTAAASGARALVERGVEAPGMLPSLSALALCAETVGLTGGLTLLAGVLASIAGVGRRHLALRAPASRVVVIAAVAASALFVVDAAAVMALHAWWPITGSDSALDLELAAGASPMTWTAAVLATVVVGPVLEELLMRGVVWATLRRFVSAPATWLITSIAFALFHPHPVQLVLALQGGLFMGWLRWRTGSVVPAMAAHAVFNALGLAARAGMPVPHGAAPVVALASIVLVACLVWLWRRGSPQPSSG